MKQEYDNQSGTQESEISGITLSDLLSAIEVVKHSRRKDEKGRPIAGPSDLQRAHGWRYGKAAQVIQRLRDLDPLLQGAQPWLITSF